MQSHTTEPPLSLATLADTPPSQKPNDDTAKKKFEFPRQTSADSNGPDMIQAQMPIPPKQRLGAPIKDIPLVDGIPTIASARRNEKIYCTSCKKTEVSDVTYVLGKGGWVWFGFFLCYFPPASCCPFCNPECQDAVHTCPECQKEVGRSRFCTDSF